MQSRFLPAQLCGPSAHRTLQAPEGTPTAGRRAKGRKRQRFPPEGLTVLKSSLISFIKRKIPGGEGFLW